MEKRSGIKYTTSAGHRYVRVDLDLYEENEALQDFLDSLEVAARKDEPTYPFDEVMREEFERRGLKND